MRGHALSSQRKFNRHWQSAGGGGIAKVWYDAVKIGGDVYTFAPRYLPDPAQASIGNYIGTKRISSRRYEYQWLIDPTLWDGTNSFSDVIYHKRADETLESVPITGDYYVLQNIQFIPHFGGLGYSADGYDFQLYYHDENQTRQVVSKHLEENFKTFKYIADVYFIRLDCGTGYSTIRTDGPAYNGDNKHILSRFQNNITRPVGYSPIWQSSKSILEAQPYGMETAVNNLAIDSEQFTYREYYIPGQSYGSFQSVGKIGYDPEYSFTYGNQKVDNFYAYPINQAPSPAVLSTGSSNYDNRAVSGYACPFCEFTDFNGVSPYYNLSGWLVPMQVQFNNSDTYNSDHYKYGIVISMKEIKEMDGKLYG